MITTTETVVVDGDLDVSLQEHLRRIGASDGIAVDIETSGLSLLDARVHVISVAVPGLTVVIPLKEHQAPLLTCQLLQESKIEKVVHHAVFDAAFLRRAFGVNLEPVFCTKVAGRIAGLDRNPTLVSLAGALLGVPINKGEQQSDWAARPLSSAQINYAARDVVFLHALKSELTRRVTDAGRWTLFAACMRFVPVRTELALLELDDVFAYKLPGPMDTAEAAKTSATAGL